MRERDSSGGETIKGFVLKEEKAHLLPGRKSPHKGIPEKKKSKSCFRDCDGLLLPLFSVMVR